MKEDEIHKAFELRQVSDYRVMERLTHQKAEETLTKANGFVIAVEEYLVKREI